MPGVPININQIEGGFLTGRKLIFPLFLVISLFFLWGFSYGLLDVLNKHFQEVLDITKLESTGLQVMYFGGGYFCFSPVAAEVLKRKGYKITILMGLALYSTGAVFFWPVAHYATPDNQLACFGGFLACTFVIACGLATLETSANSYAVVIGDPATASARLQFCQSWNGVASFIGPLIASKAFFSGENQDSLENVQYVYLAVACAGAAVAVMFFFAKLPEVQEQSKAETARRGSVADEATLEAAVDHNGHVIGDGPLFKQYNMLAAFCAQFAYVGAQVTIATFFINYATEAGGFKAAEASQMLSYGLITFTVGRFVATGLATIFDSGFLMTVYSCLAIAFTAYVSAGHGTPSVAVLICIFFWMAPMYPTIFTLGTANLGRHTRRGAGILVMGVSGGAVFPPIQGAVADAYTTRVSYVVPTIGFVFVLAYVATHWVRHGLHFLRVRSDKMIATSIEGGAGGAVGGAIASTHYDEKRLSVVAAERLRRSSVEVEPVSGGFHFSK